MWRLGCRCDIRIDLITTCRNAGRYFMGIKQFKDVKLIDSKITVKFTTRNSAIDARWGIL